MFKVHPYFLVIQLSFLNGCTVFMPLLTDDVQLTGVVENKSGRKEPGSDAENVQEFIVSTGEETEQTRTTYF